MKKWKICFSGNRLIEYVVEAQDRKEALVRLLDMAVSSDKDVALINDKDVTHIIIVPYRGEKGVIFLDNVGVEQLAGSRVCKTRPFGLGGSSPSIYISV